MSKADTLPERSSRTEAAGVAQAEVEARSAADVGMLSRTRPKAGWLRGLRVASDLLMALLGAPLFYWSRSPVSPQYIPGGEPPDRQRYAAATPVVAVTVVAVFAFMDVYRWRRGVEFINELFSVLRAMLVVGVVVLAEIGTYRDGT